MAFAKNIIFQTSVTLAGTYINCKSLDPVDVSCADLEEGGGGLGGLENPKFLNSHNNYNNVPETYPSPGKNSASAPNFYHY